MSRNVLLIDNFDSFTFNIVHSLRQLGCAVRVVRNTVSASTAFEMAVAENAMLVLSPGPGSPASAGCCLELIALAKDRIPVLGICLGHQAIVEEAGGEVMRAPEPVHGKASLMEHDGRGPFSALPSPIRVGRYHSLCTRDVPSRFRVHARIDDMAMAITDEQALQTGIQFHPESILTPMGEKILENVVR